MADSKLAELERRGVTTVRICYPDLHGICRGKEFPATFFEHLVDDGAAPNGYSRYVNNDSHVYTVGSIADPRGLLRQMMHACADLGLGAFAANHEFGRSQYEINLRHSQALDAADRAFLFKTVVK